MERLSIVDGMQVLGPDDRRLAIVTRCGAEHFLVRGPWPSNSRWAVPYSAIQSLRGGQIRLRGGTSDFLPADQPDLVDGVLTHTKPLGPGP